MNSRQFDPAVPLRAKPKAAGSRPATRSSVPEAAGPRFGRAADMLLDLQRSHGNHYVQQVLGARAAGPRPFPVIQAKLVIGAARDRYEREADATARQVAARVVGSGPVGDGDTAVRLSRVRGA